MQHKVEYLSHIIENGELKPNPAKVSALTEMKRPQAVKQIQSFLGFTGFRYYRKFIEVCSSIASPLIKLTEKNTPFIWTTSCEDAFNLRNVLVSDKVLILPDFNRPFRIETDASQYGVEGVLSQLKDPTSKQWIPVDLTQLFSI